MRAVVVLCLWCAACTPAPTCQEKVSLIDPEAWSLVALADDPWRDLAPTLREKGGDAGVVDGGAPLTACSIDDVSPELLAGEASLQVNTQFCSWATVEQPVPVDVRAGEPIHARIWYFSQTSYEAATAEIALTLDDAPIVTASVPIPSESDLVGGDYPAPIDAPAGTPIRFHIGNHGGNSWNLIEASVLREAPCPRDGG